MIKIITGIILSYLLGSIPFAYLFGKITKGLDLRQFGSGNLGATNAFRVLGKGTGTIVLLLDILKGTAAVLLANYFFYSREAGITVHLYICLSAIAVVSGHNWTLFLNFKGGKGVATSLGVLIAFAILIDKFVWIVLGIILLWLVIFLSSGFVSLSSVISSLCAPLFAIFFHLPGEITLFLAILAAFSLIRHKSNIYRLLEKKESRFDTKKLLRKLLRKPLS